MSTEGQGETDGRREQEAEELRAWVDRQFNGRPGEPYLTYRTDSTPKNSEGQPSAEAAIKSVEQVKTAGTQNKGVINTLTSMLRGLLPNPTRPLRP